MPNEKPIRGIWGSILTEKKESPVIKENNQRLIYIENIFDRNSNFEQIQILTNTFILNR